MPNNSNISRPYLLLIITLIALVSGWDCTALISTKATPPGAMECDKATLIYVEMLGEFSKKQDAHFCFDKNFIHIVSKNCQSDCTLTSKAKSDKAPLLYKQVGTPGSWACESYGGTERVMLIEHQSLKHKQSFCLLGQEVVSTPYLLSLRPKQL